MRYLEFGKTGKMISRLGFGVMRLPMKTIEESGKKVVDQQLSIPMLQKAYELGVNYYDTAPYYLESQSESVLGKALGSVRKNIYISTKYPVGDATADEFWKALHGSLERLKTDYIDFYHFWGINWITHSEKIQENLMNQALDAKKQGIIKHISFSFHGQPHELEKLADVFEYESMLCQYNLVDRGNQDAMRKAHKNGKGVVVMGPVAGGMLGTHAEKLIEQTGQDKNIKSSAELALRFVLTNPNVNVVLSGMSSMDMVVENAAVASLSDPSIDVLKINQMIQDNQKLADLYCTGCNYCMPCPKSVEIPSVFKAMNLKVVFGLSKQAQKLYVEQKNKDACVECGKCEKKCPQKLPIIEKLKQAKNTILDGV